MWFMPKWMLVLLAVELIIRSIIAFGTYNLSRRTIGVTGVRRFSSLRPLV
jgi:hypothetical protein